MLFVALSFDVRSFVFGPCHSFWNHVPRKISGFPRIPVTWHIVLVRLIRLHVSIFSHHQQTQLKGSWKPGSGESESRNRLTNYRYVKFSTCSRLPLNAWDKARIAELFQFTYSGEVPLLLLSYAISFWEKHSRFLRISSWDYHSESFSFFQLRIY